MKSTLLLSLLLSMHFTLKSQEVPEALTTQCTQTAMGLNTSNSFEDPIKSCMRFKKEGTKVIAKKCNDNKNEFIYIISKTEKKKSEPNFYSITYSGYIYYVGDPSLAFLTYSYNTSSKRWDILVECVFDNDNIGSFRTLSRYFNIE